MLEKGYKKLAKRVPKKVRGLMLWVLDLWLELKIPLSPLLLPHRHLPHRHLPREVTKVELEVPLLPLELEVEVL